MAKFFNFWDPLERRYIFNSFLIVVALIEVLIFVVTLIWQIDEGALGGPVNVVPFPWKEYFFTAFIPAQPEIIWPRMPMTSIPWAMVSGRPASLAYCGTVWIGLKSPEAPA